jgi:predicted nucleotidyltransferase
MVNSEILKNVMSFLTLIPKNLGLREAYLFGSYAKGLEKESSDVDVALVFDKMEDFFQTQQEMRKLRRKIDLRIEPHPLKSEDFNIQNPLAKEIKETGILIGKKP